MQSNTLRSVTLALLMIASVMVPLADISNQPPEMMEERVALEAPPSPCLGNDACRGTDAGNTYATAINVTTDFDWNGVNETNNYYYGGAFYEKNSEGYVVVPATAGTIVPNLPEGGEEVKIGDQTYVQFGDTYYQPIQLDGKDMYEIAEIKEEE